MGNIPKNYSIAAIVFLVALVIAGYYVMNTSYPDYQIATQQYEKTKSDNANLKVALASVQKFIENYQDQENSSELISLALPNGDSDMANFVSSLSGLAVQSGVVLSNFSIEQPSQDVRVAANAITVQDIGLNAAGSYLGLKDFLMRLERHLRLVDIYQVNLTSANDTTGAPIVTYQIKLRTYYQQ